MSRRVSATPCPVTESQIFTYRRDSIFSVDNDTTTNLDFTTDFRGSLYNSKPKRRQTGVKKYEAVLGFTIHEDEEAQINPQEERRDAFTVGLAGAARRKSIIQPLPKPRSRVSFAPVELEQDTKPSYASTNFSSSLHQAPRRPIQKRPAPPTVPEESSIVQFPAPKISKPARRGTIYIPSDDTTMPSMYMGIFSPIKDATLKENAEAIDQDGDVTGIAAQMVKRRKPRASILAASPKRIPLIPTGKISQVSAVTEDKVGQGSGKENLPPGVTSSRFGKPARKSLMPQDLSGMKAEQPYSTLKNRPRASFYVPTASSAARIKDSESAVSTVKPSWNAGARRRSIQPAPAKIKPPPQVSTGFSFEPVKTSTLKVPSRFVIPNIKQDEMTCAYPLISENLANPNMYEEDWLTHQEIAITQLINNLFRTSTPAAINEAEPGMLRSSLLYLYGNPEMAMLYKRLQGALLYGGLKISQESMDGAIRLNNDVGKRKSFTDLWLDTYEYHSLQAGLEAVVGRQCLDERDTNKVRRSSGNGAHRRLLQRFIEAFLIRNEDGKPDRKDENRTAWSYCRTLLRSLMLIKLLDQAKTNTDSTISTGLFQSTSSYKSSAAIVQAVVYMLNPSAGDPTRTLGHINYVVNHVQYPLEEYTYYINNLAVDFRDGVLLTRLVELLLYPSASELLAHGRDADATTTLLMPTGEILSLVEGQRDWPLSQHLKFPCLGRATKLFNAQIALCALQGVRGMEAVVQDIKAEDIVDGYREKTVKLLWALTSKWGLGGLVDWEDVKREIKRLKRSEGYVGFNEDDISNLLEDEEEDHARFKKLLKLWSKSVASSKGVVVKNFTTSFSDGRVFESIVDEYEQYFHRGNDKSTKKELHERLKDLGCSNQFAQLFSSSGSTASSHIFDRDFVLASLAFLCSRLLGPTRHARAAITIQRTWRMRWSKIESERKQALKSVVEACAEAARSKTQVLEAKITIWRAWCNYRDRPTLGPKQAEIVSEISSNKALVFLDQEKDEEDIWLSL